MHNGDVYVLCCWNVDEAARRVAGKGALQDRGRETIATGDLSVAIDSVALFETNAHEVSPVLAPLGILTVASIGLTAFCAANPKACFGSCPTFYLDGSTESRPVAEGFSASIAPSLEDTDIDALECRADPGDSVAITMRNEALETHVVRSIALLAAPCGHDERVLATPDGKLWRHTARLAPARCSAPEGDCTTALAERDGVERCGFASETDLAEREEIEIDFGRVPDGDWALAVTSRQTLLTTFLFYQTLAHMGTNAGEWFAALERGEPGAHAAITGLENALGGIEVLLPDSAGAWSVVATLSEAGPIASDTQVVPLPRKWNPPSRACLRMSRGLWRIDAIGLVRLSGPCEPLRIEPAAALVDGDPDEVALSKLTGGVTPLTTLPGDRYTLVFRIPEALDSREQHYELFLESRGYYIEWMRQEWLAEEDAGKVAEILWSPRSALRTMAPEFKKYESTMEAAFWNSRYANP
jgi:hypothetical protein